TATAGTSEGRHRARVGDAGCGHRVGAVGRTRRRHTVAGLDVAERTGDRLVELRRAVGDDSRRATVAAAGAPIEGGDGERPAVDRLQRAGRPAPGRGGLAGTVAGALGPGRRRRRATAAP